MAEEFTILLVEDEAADARLVAEALADHPLYRFRIETVGSLEQATTYLRQNAPDVILLDLYLPDSRGLEALEQIRATQPHVPVVVVTTLEDDEAGLAATRMGALDYLQKRDLEPRILPRILRHALERGRMSSDLVRRGEELRAFVVRASHQLRNPLTAISGLASLLTGSRGDLTPEMMERAIAGLDKESLVVTRLLDDLLDLSTTLTDDGTIEVVNVLDTVERALVERRPSEAKVEVDVPADLSVLARADRLRRIVGELLSNAFQYGGSVVRVEARALAGEVELAVTDDGPGVPSSFVPSLFQHFRRGTNATGIPGSGLGLAIARQLTERFGGTIRYVAQEGSCRFALTLPAAT